MNFSKTHERLRTECLRRIHRGDLTNTELSRQTRLRKSHLSKFLHAHGRLSFSAADRILEALHLTAGDLVDFGRHLHSRAMSDLAVPGVSHTAALFEPEIGPRAVEMWFSLPHKQVRSLRVRCVPSRQSWRRFVAVRIDRKGAESMNRQDYEGAIAVIDRHYNSLYSLDTVRPNLYVMREGVKVLLRYIDRIGTHLVIRAANSDIPANLIEVPTHANPGEYIAGRVVLIINEV